MAHLERYLKDTALFFEPMRAGSSEIALVFWLIYFLNVHSGVVGTFDLDADYD